MYIEKPRFISRRICAKIKRKKNDRSLIVDEVELIEGDFFGK